MRNKLIKTTILASLMAITLSGCGKDNNQNQSPDQVEQEITEPTLTKEAKKMTQFAELKKGDTIAEIVVKDYGTMKIKLFPKQAPKAVENFTTHAKDGYYDGVSFHRVLNDFMIQGGDPEGTGAGGESIWGAPFEDEYSDDLYPYRGALCMANRGANTNGSQFFVVQGDAEEVARIQSLVLEGYQLSMIDYVKQIYATDITQKELDRYLIYGGSPWLTKHHTVFGQLYEGFDVLDAIAGTEVVDEGGSPKTAVVIDTIRISEYQGE